MFDLDKWQEIFLTIRKNKLRTFLTVFGIGWGIFMIIILLGAGNGLETGVRRDFAGWATNSGFFWAQRTTISYGGYLPGRRVNFTNQDTELLRQNVSGLAVLAPRNQLGNTPVFHSNKSGNYSVYGDYPEYAQIQQLRMVQGRYLNALDIAQNRKTAVIGLRVQEQLFGEANPMGQYIKINGVSFKVVGVFASMRTNEDAERDEQNIFTPFSTFQQAFGFGNSVGWYGYSVKEGQSVAQVEEAILATLRHKYNIHPEDYNAIGSENLEEEFGEIMGLFTGIRGFTWFVGISTLLAGIIGVSNIMLIIVKERTREIGIRKALGATPFSIISLIIQESVFLTLLGGYTALVTGMVVVELVADSVPDTGFLGPPSVDVRVAGAALALLVVGGALAGIMPARKAAQVSPIEAIRNE